MGVPVELIEHYRALCVFANLFIVQYATGATNEHICERVEEENIDASVGVSTIAKTGRMQT